MGTVSLKTLIFTIYFVIFCVISKILFLNVYDIAGYVVDELFHIPQGLNYCNLNFTTWDPKITTLPGLYLVSTMMMAPIGCCTIYGLRLTNLIAGCINVVLFVSLFHFEHDGPKPISWSAIISGINLGILPPLYFFSHLYYTDTISVTSILIMLLLSKRGHHISAALAGVFSVIVRQTNIIWAAMLFGESVLDTFVNITSEKPRRSKKSTNHTDFWNVYECGRNFFKKGCDFKKITSNNYKSTLSYLSIMILFIVFVYVNGGIVVGDKGAHQTVFHIPQLFYFSLFCVFFALPHFCLEIFPFINYVAQNKVLSAGLIATFITIVHCNTLVHPYLLADNRHYTFYVWTKIYAKYPTAKYVLTEVYFFGMFAALKRIDGIKNFGFVLLYVPCISAVLVLQKLLDVRYFFIPFILLRLKFKTRNVLVLILEFIMYVVINYLTFRIFFTKEIFWDDFEDVQRLIW